MSYTVPHQKTVIIHREPLNNNFLGISNENWKNAARVLGAQAFLLYIYLASNKADFKLALSPSAIQQEIGMPPSTYRDQLRKLESLGFLKFDKGNTYHFYEKANHDTRSQSTNGALTSSETAAVDLSTPYIQESPPEDIEIYINNKEEINRPGVKGNPTPMSIDEYSRREYESQWYSH